MTHLGYRPYTGRIHAAKSYGHASYSGKIHALTAEGIATYRAACGVVVAVEHDEDNDRPNVWPASEGGEVTCQRCLSSAQNR